MIKVGERLCPICGKIIKYNSSSGTLKYYYRAIKRNSVCRSCIAKINNANPETKEKISKSNLGKKMSEETRKKLSLSHIGHKVSQETKEKISRYNKGKKISDEQKEKIRQSLIGHKHSDLTKKKIGLSSLGRHHTDESRRKIRVSLIKTLEKRYSKKIYPLYNPDACKIIDEYGKKNGYNFQHALNGGEFYVEDLGYWVDGYDRDKNVVIEYYEPWHEAEIRKVKDVRRKKEIIDKLHCKFIILKENEC
jgi:hypothetical protein